MAHTTFSVVRLIPRIPSPGGKPGKPLTWRRRLNAAALAAVTTLAVLAITLLRQTLAADHVRFRGGLDSPARILVMTSATGGGHGAAAAAIKYGLEALNSSMGGFDVRVQDMFADHCPWPFSEFPGTYKFLMRNPWLWRAIYYGSQHGTGRLMNAITFLVESRVQSEILDRQPDVIVSVHPMMQHVPLKMLTQSGRPPCNPEDVDSWDPAGVAPSRKCTPFVTVVTDTETGSNLWFHPGVTRTIVPDAKLARRGRRHGLKASQLLQAPALLVAAQFQLAARVGQGEVREALGLCADCRVVLLMGGGDGAGNMDHYARVLHRQLGHATDVQIVVICGRNEKIRSRLSRQLNHSRVDGSRPVRVLGFRRDMALWMRASDLLLTKAGPSTIAEALTVGLPVLLYSYLPGQERGNVDLVVRSQVGAYTPGAHNSARAARKILFDGNGTVLKDMKERVRDMTYGVSATSVVVSEIAHMATFSKSQREERHRKDDSSL